MKILALLTALTLTGCAGITGERQSAAPGMASYEINRSADGACRVRITSGREVLAGGLIIGPDCTVEATADGLSGLDAQMQMIDLFGTVLDRIP